MENANLGQKSPRAIELLKRVPGGDKLVPHVPKKEEVTPPVEAKPVVPPVIETDKSDYDINPPKVETNNKEPETPKEPLAEPDFVPDDPTDEDVIDPKKDVTKQNFINLRTKYKTANKEVRELKPLVEDLKKKVTDFETGVAVPEVVEKLNARIAELEPYEKVLNFKNSPVYLEKFAKPIKENQDKLVDLAKDYPDVSAEVLNAAFSAPTELERNRILSQHFKDDVAALEARAIMKDIRKVQTEAMEAEKEPAQSLARMQAENDRIVNEQRAKANEGIVYSSKEAWSESLLHLREDPRFPEITYREGDSEHNEKFVRPILTKAGQEYGRFIKGLAQHGLTELPKDYAIAAARSFQLAHQAAVVAFQRDELLKEVNELRALIKTKTHLNRPGINGVTADTGGGAPASGVAVGPLAAGRNVLSRVTSGKK